jgi:hypothetical protein
VTSADSNVDPNAFSELRENQQALRDQLKKLQEEMKRRGLGQSQKGQDGQQGQQGQGQQQQSGQGGDDLADADSAMGDAEQALGEGNSDRAIDGQGRAIDAMRKGAQNLAQELQQQGQQGQGGPYGPPGRMSPSRADRDTDPLGRPMRGRDYGDDTSVKVPGEIDAQRARRIIEELRKRFGESFRPQLELDYIERLLKDYWSPPTRVGKATAGCPLSTPLAIDCFPAGSSRMVSSPAAPVPTSLRMRAQWDAKAEFEGRAHQRYCHLSIREIPKAAAVGCRTPRRPER